MSDDPLDDFLAEVPQGREGEKAPVAADSPEALKKFFEENILRASTGLSFRCGVCSTFHRTSNRSAVAAVGKCIDSVLKRAMDGAHPRAVTMKPLPSESEADTLRLTYSEPVLARDRRIVAVNPVMAAAYPRLVARYRDEIDRIRSIYSRTFVEDISLREVLGAADASVYLSDAIQSFVARSESAYEVAQEHARRDAAPILDEMSTVWKMPVEKWHCTIFREIGKEWYREGGWSPRAIASVDLNGQNLSAGEVLNSFSTLNECRFRWWNMAQSVPERVLLEVGLIRGTPAIVWGLAERTGRSQRVRYMRRLGVIQFLSTWDGSIYLDRSASSSLIVDQDVDVHTRAKLRRNFVKIVPETVEI